MVITKRIEYEIGHHVEAERALRRWGRIGLHVLRMTFLLAVLATWFGVGEWVADQEMKKTRFPMRRHSMREESVKFLPYALWIPLGAWAWYRVKLARRKAWIERVSASGVRQVEFSEQGLTYESDWARCFFRWDSFPRVVDCKRVMVLFLNRATAILLPKIEMSGEETNQVLEWKKHFAAGGTPLDSAASEAKGDVVVWAEPNYGDYRESVRIQQTKGRKLSLVIRRWVGVGLICMAVLALAAITLQDMWFRRGPRDLEWYWMLFGLPSFLALVFLSSWGFVMLIRWLTWRDVRASVTEPQKLCMNEEGVEVRAARWLHHFRWQAFNSLDVGSRVVMLGLVGGGHLIIPRRQMPMGDARFVEYLRRHVVTMTQAFPVQMAVLNEPTIAEK